MLLAKTIQVHHFLLCDDDRNNKNMKGDENPNTTSELRGFEFYL